MDYENLITSSAVIDSGTAEILGEYYMKGKYFDFWAFVGLFGGIILILVVLGYFKQ